MIGVNWHLNFRLKIEELQKENEELKIKNNILKRKVKKYEDNNIRSTRDREDNNTVKSGRSVYTARR